MSQQPGKGIVDSVEVIQLKTEYLVDPKGIDSENPRFSWQIKDRRPGAGQESFQLVVSTDSSLLQEQALVYNSGKIQGSEQLYTYKGKTLQPFTRYFWAVRIWERNGLADRWSPMASFETGFLKNSHWRGAWISDGNGIDHKPAPYFRKEFHLRKAIRSARAYIATAGLFELFINGSRAGDHRLDPMYTRFDRRTLYVTHDITRELQTGMNALGVVLGNGWYNHQSTAVWNFHQAPWRARPAFCMDIRIEYLDGTVETFGTGKDWKTSAEGPLVFNSIYTAEHYDARKVMAGWNRPGFSDSAWKAVTLRSAPSGNIVAQSMHPVRNTVEIPARYMRKFNDTVYVFDIGRNIAGVSRLRVKGEPGTVIRLKHGERVYQNGRVDLSNIDVHYRPTGESDPFQTDIFILSGNGEEEFTPSFNYKGFQYVEVAASHPIQLDTSSLKAYFVHSDVPVAGKISASNPLIEKIWQATNNSYLSNLYGYPTDCPQREKNGWTGDAHIAIETGLYNFDAITVYEKWLADHRDEQQPNGVLPSIIPTGGWGYEWGNGPDWTSSIAIIPWQVYLFYGDTTLLSRSYENIRRYVDYLSSVSPDGICTWGQGDWVPVKSKTPVEFTSTAYFYADALILSKAAKLLGRQEDHLLYKTLARKIYAAFNAKYYNPGTGIYGTGLQTELSVALHWGLVPEERKQKVAANLAKRVEADGGQIDVGLLGTKTILNALSDNGYAELAYKLATRDSFPSWGWWIKNGATTLYENWPIDAKSDISMNHIMFGEIGAWLYKGLGGIKPDENSPGFRHIMLAPNFPATLDRFEAIHQSPYGEIISGWTRKGKKLLYKVVIPPNASATLRLPSGSGVQREKEIHLAAGTHQFEWK
ncbi:family 78 glycoside hydrolase catalytic domain [Flavihumibacter stibioxidans]|uniref:alpha-L-rhamnosidase n=1 Tax=Flavihumibacter stibioxidans TaxID=1834163 RepID=UPI001FEC1690|nr:alpha-L-rhamnosidase [Flavihumibacter stibioxidans]